MSTGDAAVDEVVDTPRLRLRPVHEGHAEAIARLMTPALSRWLASWPSPITTTAVAARIASIREAIAAGRTLCFAIERRDDSAMIGWVSVTRSQHDAARGNLGYWLGEPFQQHGYMTEAARATLVAGFARLDLATIEAGAQPDNEASLRIMRKLGMRPIGVRSMWASARGREELCEYYEITRDACTASGTTGSSC
jgi:ribosomal-protein-alanine N-acetyltransferase